MVKLPRIFRNLIRRSVGGDNVMPFIYFRFVEGRLRTTYYFIMLCLCGNFKKQAYSCARTSFLFDRSNFIQLRSVPKCEKCSEGNTFSICGRGKFKKWQNCWKRWQLKSYSIALKNGSHICSVRLKIKIFFLSLHYITYFSI